MESEGSPPDPEPSRPDPGEALQEDQHQQPEPTPVRPDPGEHEQSNDDPPERK